MDLETLEMAAGSKAPQPSYCPWVGLGRSDERCISFGELWGGQQRMEIEHVENIPWQLIPTSSDSWEECNDTSSETGQSQSPAPEDVQVATCI